MEEWDLYDKHRIKTGKVVRRGQPLNADGFRLVVHVCIINSTRQMLIQQRQPFKEGWPNKWDLTVGGSALAGESSNEAAERELFEEIGYRADLSQMRPRFTVNFESGFDDYYVLEADINLEDLALQESEVKKVKWASQDEIARLITLGEFIPYYQSVIDMLFAMRSVGGAFFR